MSWLLDALGKVDGKDWVNWALAAAAVVAGLWAGLLQRGRPLPVFIYQETQIHTRGHPRLSVLFDGTKTIRNLTRLVVCLRNNGNKEIRKEDLPLTTRPSVEFPETVDILSAAVLQQSSKGIAASVVSESSAVRIEFEYLNPDEYIAFEIFYDDPDEPRSNGVKPPIKFSADIKGGKQVKASEFMALPVWNLVAFACMAAVLAFSMGMAAFAIWNTYLDEQVIGYLLAAAAAGLFALASACAVVGCAVTLVTGKSYRAMARGVFESVSR